MGPYGSRNDAWLPSRKLLQSSEEELRQLLWERFAPCCQSGAGLAFTITAVSLFQASFFSIHSTNAGNPTCNLKLRISLIDKP